MNTNTLLTSIRRGALRAPLRALLAPRRPPPPSLARLAVGALLPGAVMWLVGRRRAPSFKVRLASAVAAVASGALAVGAMSVGALAIAKLAVKQMRITRLRIDELEVRRTVGAADAWSPAETSSPAT